MIRSTKFICCYSILARREGVTFYRLEPDQPRGGAPPPTCHQSLADRTAGDHRDPRRHRSGDGDELSAARRFAEGWERQDFAAMYGEISPQTARRYSLGRVHRRVRHGPGDGDGGQGDDWRSLRGRVRGSARGGGARQPRDPRLRADLRPRRCCPWPTRGSPGRRTWSSRGSGPRNSWCGARRSPSGRRSLLETERRLPRGPPPAAPRRLARPPRASPARSARPASSRTASCRGSDSRPARRPGPAASSWRSTGVSPDGRAVSWSRSAATAAILPAAGPCLPAPSRSRASPCTRRSTPASSRPR